MKPQRAISLLLFIFSLSFFSCSEQQEVQKQVPVVIQEKPKPEPCAVDTLNAAEKQRLLEEYFVKLNKKHGFNGNVLIAQNGTVLYKNAFGFANFKTKDSLTLNSEFQLASVSKQFTAVAIMILKEKGKLQYTDKVTSFIPEFPYPEITINELLAHRSGLPNYMYFCDHLCQNTYTPVSNDDVLELMETKRPEEYYRHGKRFQYSNTNYCILAKIIERISGQEFSEFLESNIFLPLEMKNTRVYSMIKNPVIPNEAIGHDYRRKHVERNYLNGVVGDKGIYSTVEDLFKWEQALFNNKLLKKETLEEAFTPKNEKRRKNSNYGYGWRIYFMPDSTQILYHGGWWQGFRNNLVHIPKDKISIIVLSNYENRSFTFNNVDDILNMIYSCNSGNSDISDEEQE
jgi:CubicO group peptidase (beta-lactamase class C family)